MICQPSTRQQLTDELKGATARGAKGIAFDLQALNHIVAHNPADMTVTTEAGLTLAALQEVLAQHGQWLPIDPPNPRVLTVADVLNGDVSGPHRFGYGTVREHLLGLTVALADGRLIHAGGKVVKNVAGYDLCKLFVGSRGSLGVPIEATFKVRPLPEAAQFVAARCASLFEAGALLDVIHDSQLAPVVLDLHNVAVKALQAPEVFDGDKSPQVFSARTVLPLPVRNERGEGRGEGHPTADTRTQLKARRPASPQPSPPSAGGEGEDPSALNTYRSPHSKDGLADYCIVLGFEGTREEVQWQLAQAAQLGLAAPADLGHEKTFCNLTEGAPAHCLSTLPSRMIEAIHGLGAVQFVARAGNGVIHYHGGNAPPKPEMPRRLMRRVKDAYDPKHILPDFPESIL